MSDPEKTKAYSILDETILPAIRQCLDNGYLVVLIGATGTGKSVLASKALPTAARVTGLDGRFSVNEDLNAAANLALPTVSSPTAFYEFSWLFSSLVAQVHEALGIVPTLELNLADIADIEPLFIRYARHVLAFSGVVDWENQLDRTIAKVEATAANARGGSGAFVIPKSLQGRNPEVIALAHLAKNLNLRIKGQETPGVNDILLQGLCTAIQYDKALFDKIITSLSSACTDLMVEEPYAIHPQLFIRNRNQTLAAGRKVLITGQVWQDVEPVLEGLKPTEYRVFDLNKVWKVHGLSYAFKNPIPLTASVGLDFAEDGNLSVFLNFTCNTDSRSLLK